MHGQLSFEIRKQALAGQAQAAFIKNVNEFAGARMSLPAEGTYSKSLLPEGTWVDYIKGAIKGTTLKQIEASLPPSTDG